MIGVEEWAEIRRLHRAERRSIRAIARELGLARNTVRAAIRSAGPPRYARAGRGSIVDAVEDAIRRELAACPTMPVTVVAERIGWTRGLTVLRERVRELRPVYQPPDPYQPVTSCRGDDARWAYVMFACVPSAQGFLRLWHRDLRPLGYSLPTLDLDLRDAEWREEVGGDFPFPRPVAEDPNGFSYTVVWKLHHDDLAELTPVLLTALRSALATTERAYPLDSSLGTASHR